MGFGHDVLQRDVTVARHVAVIQCDALQCAGGEQLALQGEDALVGVVKACNHGIGTALGSSGDELVNGIVDEPC